MAKYFLAVKNSMMKFHACHGHPVEAESVDAFLSMKEPTKVVEMAKRHGDSVRAMQWVEDDNKPHILLREIC